MINRARLQQIFWRMRSPGFNHSGPPAFRSVAAVLAGSRAHLCVQLFNENAIKARVVQAAFEESGSGMLVETGTYHAATTISARLCLRPTGVSCDNSAVAHDVSSVVTLGMRGISLRQRDSSAFVRQLSCEIAAKRSPVLLPGCTQGIARPGVSPACRGEPAYSGSPTVRGAGDDVRVTEVDHFRWGIYCSTMVEIGCWRRRL